MRTGNKGAAFMLYLASVDKVAELAADPRAVLPAKEPAYLAWRNEARVATRARDLYKQRWEGK
jgi:hypothetical protein